MKYLFFSKLKTGSAFINQEDVDEAISLMGTAEDMGIEDDTEPTNSSHSTTSKSKKLFRDPEDRVLSGTCSGLAAYFGLDASVVRVIFLLLVLFAYEPTLLFYVYQLQPLQQLPLSLVGVSLARALLPALLRIPNKKELANRPCPGEHHFVSAYLVPKLFSINQRIPDYINPDGTKGIIGDIVYYQDHEHQFGIEVKFHIASRSNAERH